MTNLHDNFSGFSHSFDTGIACKLGMEAAAVFNHILYWLQINASKKDAQTIDGKFWMYETQKEIADSMPYLSEDQVYRSIKLLLDHGYLIKSHMNKNKFDRTNWYTVFDQSIILIKKSLSKPQNCGIESASTRNANRDSAVSDSANLRNDHISNILTEEKQQQQKPVVAVFSCLENLKDIPQFEKEWLTKTYSEDVVKHAIAYAYNPKVIIRETRIQCIKWACQALPEIPKSEEEKIEINKKTALTIEKEGHKYYDIRAQIEYLEIVIGPTSKTVRYNLPPEQFNQEVKEILEGKQK